MDLGKFPTIVDTAIVVPTLGTRSKYLADCLSSIREAGESCICIVAPDSIDLSELETAGLIDIRVSDPNQGLATAINHGFKSLPEQVKFIAWLGDDDLLELGSLEETSSILRENDDVVAVFGGCNYINESGNQFMTNRSGPWATWLIRIGPNLLPQPGSLMRRSTFNSFGGLRPDLHWSFDIDMFINLSKHGKVKHIDQILSSFRWHPDSLSVGQRDKSVREASQIRVSHLPRGVRSLSFIWEPAVRFATKRAGLSVNKRLRKISN
jgi:GT2 family glycosyltransferase